MAVTLVMAMSAVLYAQSPQYRARLAIVPIDIAMQATIAGSGAVTDLKAVHCDQRHFTALRTAATVARVHRRPVRRCACPVGTYCNRGPRDDRRNDELTKEQG